MDLLRRNAKALVDAFPQTLPKLAELGYADAQAVLETPITNAVGVARFVDSLFNACVPLPQPVHTGSPPRAWRSVAARPPTDQSG